MHSTDDLFGSRALTTNTRIADFEQFWTAYPRKVGKLAARTAWAKMPRDIRVETILAALDWQRNQPQWKREHGRYVPHPASWLHQQRWEDEPFQTPDPTSAAWDRVMTGRGKLI